MNIPFVPADSSNYYSGRGGNLIKYIVMHYTANDGDTRPTGKCTLFCR